MTTRLLVHGADVFDPISGTTAAADIVIEADRIIEVGPSLDGDKQIDATGHLGGRTWAHRLPRARHAGQR